MIAVLCMIGMLWYVCVLSPYSYETVLFTVFFSLTQVRRERISERLKVLQTLIPNGDKVDMVTMLEKAINYVQCLELQIRV